jgi:hypothetical protein
MGWIIAGVVVLGMAATLAVISRAWRKDGKRFGSNRPADFTVLKGFTGGVKWEGGNATVPLARLEVFPWGIRIWGSVRPLRWILPCWEAPYSDIDHVQSAKSTLGGRGVGFHFTDGSEVVFWTTEPDKVVAQLSSAGVAAESSVKRVPFRW